MAVHRLCTIPGCSKPHKARDLCRLHWWRWRRYGDPLIIRKTPPGCVQTFFHETVLPYEGTECLIWPFSSAKGYPYMTVPPRRRIYVGRHILELVQGPAPSPEYEAAHSCGKGHLGCVSPKHLRWATRAENRDDMLAHGTRYRGEMHYLTKLTEDDVRQIRALKGTQTQRQIGKKFGVSDDVVGFIHRGISWSWLT